MFTLALPTAKSDTKLQSPMKQYFAFLVTGLLAFICAPRAAATHPVLTEDAARVVLRNDRLTLALGKAEKGAIVSLVDNASGREFVAKQAAPQLFTLTFSTKDDPKGKLTGFSSRDAGSVKFGLASSGGRRVVTLDFDGIAGQPIHVTCTATVAEADPLVRWRLSAEFPEPFVLEEIQFPLCVLRAPLGESVTGDAAVLGLTKGGVIRRPGERPVGSRVHGNQPGSLAAQFACYYDSHAGFYTAAHDSRGTPKYLALHRVKEGVELFWNPHAYATKKFAFDFDVVMTTFTGAGPGVAADWRDAADIYKEWALTQPWCARRYADRDDLPDWMKAGPAMVRFGREWLARPASIEKWLHDYWQKYFAGPPLITAYWGWEKHGSWVTPDYFPIYPDDEQFTALVAAARKLGCHAFPWPSGYHWTLTYRKQADGSFEWDDRKRFDEAGRAHAVHLRDGKLYIRTPSWLAGGDTTCLCPGDPWTLAWWNHDVCVPLAKRGAELIQVDQVVGGSFPNCYDLTHGHPPGPGLWMTDVFERQLRTMLAACRAVERDAVVCFEEPNERFNHLVGIQDYRDCETPHEPASVFNYLYHEFLPVFQSNPHAGDTAMAAHCFADGQIPHLVPSQRGGGPALLNGGFEDWSNSAFSGWSQVHSYNGREWNGSFFRDDAEKHDGAASIRLENAVPTDVVQVSQNVIVGDGLLAGRKYRLSAWLKTGSMAKPNGIGFGIFKPGLKSAGVGGRFMFPEAGAGWTRCSAEFTVPEDAATLRIMIHIEGKAKAWVDDMALEEVLPGGASRVALCSNLPPDHQLMKRWVELYHGEGRPYLQFGRMLHPPKLTAGTITWRDKPMAAVLHNAWRAPDGSEAVIAVNATRVKQTATLDWKGREHRIALEPGDAVLIR